MNPIELFENPNITDVLISGDKQMLVECSGEVLVLDTRFSSEAEALQYAKSLFENTNSRFDLGNPFAETNMHTAHGKIRIHALYGGECSELTQISLRRHPEKHFTLLELQEKHFLNQEQLTLLRQIVEEKKNFVIVGSTGTGKTTLLRAMLNEVNEERIITIEDSPELNLSGRTVSLFSRNNNQEGVGEITLSDLVKASLRMRPDRIVIGEARGEELKVLLSALNTGHQGAGFTLHANSSQDVFARMQILLAMGGITKDTASELISAAIQYCIEIRRVDGVRKIVSIEKLEALNV